MLRHEHSAVGLGSVAQDGVVTPHTGRPGASPVLIPWRRRRAASAIANELIAEFTGTIQGRHDGLSTTAAPSHDPVIERLGMALLESEQLGGAFGPIYADCLSIAIVSRMLALTSGAIKCEKRSVAELTKWRLKRVFDYVDAHLNEPISLADVAGAAGLTRMHFAAQFRAATGLRPHEYLLRRRIERAQVLLCKNVPTVNVALAVGFQSQAHFTSVFKRFVGQPPHTWRRLSVNLGPG